MRHLYKNEHWAPCRNQTLSWYDWKIVESDVKPEQTTTTKIILKYPPYLLHWLFSHLVHDALCQLIIVIIVVPVPLKVTEPLTCGAAVPSVIRQEFSWHDILIEEKFGHNDPLSAEFLSLFWPFVMLLLTLGCSTFENEKSVLSFHRFTRFSCCFFLLVYEIMLKGYKTPKLNDTSKCSLLRVPALL